MPKTLKMSNLARCVILRPINSLTLPATQKWGEYLKKLELAGKLSQRAIKRELVLLASLFNHKNFPRNFTHKVWYSSLNFFARQP